MKIEQTTQWLTGSETAALLGVCASRVRQLRLVGDLPGRLTPGGWLYERALVDDLADHRGQQTA